MKRFLSALMAVILLLQFGLQALAVSGEDFSSSAGSVIQTMSEPAESTPADSSSAPESTSADSSSAPESTPADSSSAPESTPADSSSAPESTPADSSSAPESTPADSSSAPESTPADSSSAPESTPADSSSAPESTPADSGSAPESTPADSSSAPAEKPAESRPAAPYADSDGDLIPLNGWVVSDGTTYYYVDNVPATRYFTVDGAKYYAYENGAVITFPGWFTRWDGKTCYAGEGGVISEGFVQIGGVTFCLMHTGLPRTRYFTVNGAKYYADDNGIVITAPGWFDRWDGKRCYAGEGGVISEGFVTVDGEKYALMHTGLPRTGRFAIGEKQYYANEAGVLKEQYFTDTNGEIRYSYASGRVRIIAGWFVRGDGVRCYSSEGGVIVPGTVVIDGVEYCLDAEGKPTTGFFEKDGVLYYMGENGLAKGLFTVEETLYYAAEDGSIKARYFTDKNGAKRYSFADGKVLTEKGWFARWDGKNCYAGEGGVIPEGFVTIEGSLYCLMHTGLPRTGEFTLDGKKYYADENGILKARYFTDKNGAKRYSDAKGLVLTKSGWFTRWDGKTCWAAEGGVLVEGMTTINGGKYCLMHTGLPRTGEFTLDGKKYYADSNGLMKARYFTDKNGDKRYSYESGRVRIIAGWFTRWDGVTCYSFDGGVIKEGFFSIGGKKYCLMNTGKPRTGEFTLNDILYYADEDGVMKARYYTDKKGNKRYSHANGQVITTAGWFTRWDGERCYAGSKGYIKAGFVKDGADQCYVMSTGKKQTGLFSVVPSDGIRRYYYANEKGALQTGWQKIGGHTYYFYSKSYKDPYRAAIGTCTLGGQKYTFDAQGRLISLSNCIDVSAYQGYIDWQKVADSGVEYAIIRAVTWSGGTDGWWVEDAFFDYNVKHAKAAGIKVGAYIFTYAFTTEEVRQEANVFLNAANRLKAEGYTLDLPVFVDYEYARILTAIPDKGIRTAVLKYEMDYLRQNGYYSGMYMSSNWALDNVDAATLQAQGYDLWIADYRGYNGWEAAGKPKTALWQFSATGTVPGITGEVDLNYIYKDYSDLIHGSTNNTVTESKWTVYDQGTGKNVSDTMENLLAAIVNNEVGGTALTGQDRQKLFRAQAIAAHSWLLYQYENSNTTPSVKLKYDGNYAAVKGDIRPVLSKVLTYNGKAANTVYTSCNNGTTNSSKDYWGNDLPYLTHVTSAYEKYGGAAGYQKKVVTVSGAKMNESLYKLFGQSFTTTMDPAQWIQITSRNTAGYVTGVKVCGQAVPISTFVETVYGPLSPDFTVSYASGSWTFTSNGFGHGVGMSQYGAMGMIAQGLKGYAEVLAHYYPGTTLTTVG